LVELIRVRIKLFSIVVACIVGVAFGDEIRITSAPVDNQVFQRNADQTADFQLIGTAIGKKVNNKDVEARLTGADTTPLPGFDWTPVGKIVKLKWSGSIKHVPAGGPYRLEVRLQGTDQVLSIANLLVGDLWVLAGQSNMEGYGYLVDVQQSSPLVRTFDMADRWGVAEEPLHTLVNAVDPVHWPLNAQKEPERLAGEQLETYVLNRKRGAGLGLSFAVEMLTRTGTPIGLIPCAHGGTSMEQWSPALKDREGESLYGSMLRRVKAAGGRVKGVLWYQGESDANAKAAPVFLQKFEEFVQAVRTDLNQPDLPFYYVQIGRHIDKTNVAEWNAIQLAQLRAESEIPHSAMVASVDLEMDDGIHIATQDLKRLGRRLADLVCHDLFPRIKDFGERKSGPRPVQAVYQNGIVKMTFSGVNGKLQSDGPITGFSIRDEKGEWTPMIFKARVDPAEASSVLLYVQGRLPENAMLWYGFGKDPDCTMRDATDLPVPVFALKIGTATVGTR
ncbi:MAG TPA: sialate O-acetylesterase, partial [Bryobacteraceae bacterium]|nr:sialate O-acetylesterase [Bryobacteraceae bacterium]